MDDLVKRLRGGTVLTTRLSLGGIWHDERCLEAADAIEVLQAQLADARRAALEEAAKCCDDEADRCDDAAKWGGSKRYVQDCKAAAYAMYDRAAAIRALAEKH